MYSMRRARPQEEGWPLRRRRHRSHAWRWSRTTEIHGRGLPPRYARKVRCGSPLSPMIARQVLKRLRAPDDASARKTDEDETTLTAREGEILNAISRGFSYAETAQMLGISVGTVHTFLKRIYRKLAVHSKTEAVFEGNRLGLIR